MRKRADYNEMIYDMGIFLLAAKLRVTKLISCMPLNNKFNSDYVEAGMNVNHR